MCCVQHHHQQQQPGNPYDQEIKSGGFSSSSEEFSSPLPAHHPHHQTHHNHPNNTQFSPTNPYFQNGGQGSRRNYIISPTTAAQLASESGGRIRADPMGNIFIVPRQMDPVGVCQCCRNAYGSHDHYHQHHAHVSPDLAELHQGQYKEFILKKLYPNKTEILFYRVILTMMTY